MPEVSFLITVYKQVEVFVDDKEIWRLMKDSELIMIGYNSDRLVVTQASLQPSGDTAK